MRTELAQTLKRIALGAALATAATSGFAATQGTTGFTSTGDLVITLGVVDEVRISGLADIPLGNFTGADVSNNSPACVYRNGTGAYSITATGSGAANAFTLTNGTNSVNYSVTYHYLTAAGVRSLATGVPLTSTGGDSSADDCGGVPNASIEVTVAAVDAAGLPASTYTGTLTLLVSPN